jgi:hypothetical protein
MSEDRRLRDKLAKLADDASGAGERRLSGDGRNLAEAIVEEVDEAILGRRLTFRTEDGAVLALEAANRRLLRIVELPDDIAAPADRAGLLAPLPQEDEAALAAVAGVIGRFAEGRRELSVEAAPLDRAPDPGARGRSASAVAEALGFTLYDRPAPVPMPDPARGFDAGLGRLALAAASVSGDERSPATGPDADAVGRLSALGQEDLAGLLAELGPESAQGGPFLLLQGPEEALFVARKPSGRAVVALLPGDRADAILGLWRATRGD